MKKIRLLHLLSMLSFISITALFINCSNKLEVNAEWKDIAYVYGLLDHTVDTQFVRIGKAFLADQAPSETAQNPDSIYYADDLLVHIIELNADGNEVRRFELDKWDRPGQLNPGNFADDNHHLYITEETLDPQYVYRLEFEKPNGDLVWAETPLVDWGNDSRGGFRSPNVGIQRLLFAQQFTNSQGNLQSINSTIFSWSRPENGRFYEFRLHIHYKEMRLDTRRVENKKLIYNSSVPDQTTSADPQSGVPSMESFLSFMVNNLDEDPNIMRFIDYFTVEVRAGAEELFTFINVNRPGQGIVQERPQYTNIEGGVGIFSSRSASFFRQSPPPVPNQPVIRIRDMQVENWKTLVLDACNLNFARTVVTDTCYCNNGQIVTLNPGGASDCQLSRN